MKTLEEEDIAIRAYKAAKKEEPSKKIAIYLQAKALIKTTSWGSTEYKFCNTIIDYMEKQELSDLELAIYGG